MGMDDMVKVACPVASSGTDPIACPLSRNVTNPVGMPKAPETVAVNVTGVSTLDGLAEETTSDAEAALAVTDVKVTAVEPTKSVVTVSSPGRFEERWRTQIVVAAPMPTGPELKPPLHPSEYSPLTTDTFTNGVIPAIVTVLDVT